MTSLRPWLKKKKKLTERLNHHPGRKYLAKIQRYRVSFNRLIKKQKKLSNAEDLNSISYIIYPPRVSRLNPLPYIPPAEGHIPFIVFLQAHRKPGAHLVVVRHLGIRQRLYVPPKLVEALFHFTEEYGGGRSNLDAPHVRLLLLCGHCVGRKGSGSGALVGRVIPRQSPVVEVREEVRQGLEIVPLRLTWNAGMSTPVA